MDRARVSALTITGRAFDADVGVRPWIGLLVLALVVVAIGALGGAEILVGSTPDSD